MLSPIFMDHIFPSSLHSIAYHVRPGHTTFLIIFACHMPPTLGGWMMSSLEDVEVLAESLRQTVVRISRRLHRLVHHAYRITFRKFTFFD